MRKLPVYLLLDTSASMQGEPIESMKKGIDSMISSLLRNPQAIESVYISVITFNSIAEVKIPLTELVSFQLMNLVAMGQTALGAGLKLLADRINSEVIKTTPERKGDWKPIVFIITDGAPIDNWQKGLDYFSSCKTAFTVACAVGSHADTTVLKKITNDVINLEKTDGDSMSRFFLWLSSSINVSSNQVEKDGAGRTLFDLDKLPPPPPEINIIK